MLGMSFICGCVFWGDAKYINGNQRLVKKKKKKSRKARTSMKQQLTLLCLKAEWSISN